LNRPGEAAPFLEKALPEAEEDAEALFELGFALYQAARWDQAVALLDDVLRLDPGRADAHLYRGLALHAAGNANPEDKHAAFESALALEPGRADVAEHYANVLYEDGLRDRACAVYARLRPADVRDPDTLERMLELFQGRLGTLWKRWALGRRLRKLRRIDPMEEFLRGLQEEWDAERNALP
jgi:tetratricopeptide (TPR) repeat protein